MMVYKRNALTGKLVILALFIFSVLSYPALSAENNGKMSNKRLGEIIKRLDANVTGQPGYWRFSVDGVNLLVITDERANRMRIISPVASAKDLGAKRLYRIMQANYDSALDARYAVAKKILWSAFIHPLNSLGDKEFISGVGQVATLSKTYGRGYSSGGLVFRGGDSEALKKRGLIDRLMDKGLVL